jgi:hypothetical protein
LAGKWRERDEIVWNVVEFGEECDGPVGTSVLGFRMPETNVFSTSSVHLKHQPGNAARVSAGPTNNVDGSAATPCHFACGDEKGASEQRKQERGNQSTAASTHTATT